MPRAPAKQHQLEAGAAGPSGGGGRQKTSPTGGAADKRAGAKKQAAKAGNAAGGPAGAGAGAPADAMTIEERIRQNKRQLQDVERQIFNLETQYFENANPQGNALRGYEGLLSSTAVSVKKAQFKMEDRIFSGSSVSGHLHIQQAQLAGAGGAAAGALQL